MSNCLQSTTQADIQAKNYIFKASGYTVTFDGYTVLYEEGKDEEEEAKGALPVLENGMPLKCKELVETSTLHTSRLRVIRKLL